MNELYITARDVIVKDLIRDDAEISKSYISRVFLSFKNNGAKIDPAGKIFNHRHRWYFFISEHQDVEISSLSQYEIDDLYDTVQSIIML